MLEEPDSHYACSLELPQYLLITLLRDLRLPYHSAVILSLNRDGTLQFKATM